jgi:hypothetical protein
MKSWDLSKWRVAAGVVDTVAALPQEMMIRSMAEVVVEH